LHAFLHPFSEDKNQYRHRKFLSKFNTKSYLSVQLLTIALTMKSTHFVDLASMEQESILLDEVYQ